ncbi:putative oxidoreductase YncB [Vibrio ponticus]|nr:putative oxidoreductase YncB [Vibrio ponticus]
MTDPVNRRIVLASRPVGAPVEDNFRLEDAASPNPNNGEMLLRSVYLSLDPYMRGRMSDAKSYADPVKLDEIMVGGTVCQVVESKHADFEQGEWVLAYTGWQDYGISNGEGLIKLGMNQPILPTHWASWVCQVLLPIWGY